MNTVERERPKDGNSHDASSGRTVANTGKATSSIRSDRPGEDLHQQLGIKITVATIVMASRSGSAVGRLASSEQSPTAEVAFFLYSFDHSDCVEPLLRLAGRRLFPETRSWRRIHSHGRHSTVSCPRMSPSSPHRFRPTPRMQIPTPLVCPSPRRPPSISVCKRAGSKPSMTSFTACSSHCKDHRPSRQPGLCCHRRSRCAGLHSWSYYPLTASQSTGGPLYRRHGTTNAQAFRFYA